MNDKIKSAEQALIDATATSTTAGGGVEQARQGLLEATAIAVVIEESYFGGDDLHRKERLLSLHPALMERRKAWPISDLVPHGAREVAHVGHLADMEVFTLPTNLGQGGIPFATNGVEAGRGEALPPIPIGIGFADSLPLQKGEGVYHLHGLSVEGDNWSISIVPFGMIEMKRIDGVEYPVIETPFGKDVVEAGKAYRHPCCKQLDAYRASLRKE